MNPPIERSKGGYDDDDESWKRDDWKAYRIHVVRELERLNDVIVGLDKTVQQIDRDVLSLKIKAGLWGAGITLAINIGIQALRAWQH